MSVKSHQSANVVMGVVDEQFFLPLANSKRFTVSVMDLGLDHIDSSLQPIVPYILKLSRLANAIRALENLPDELSEQVIHQMRLSASVEIMHLAQHIKDAGDRKQLERLAGALSGVNDEKTVYTEMSEYMERELFLLLGKLSTWIKKSTQYFHSFLAAIPDERRTQMIAMADAAFSDSILPSLRRHTHSELGISSIPLYLVCNLIACGGEASRFPKHFSYFLPEDQNVKRARIKKTVVFANLYKHRFEMVTIPLYRRFIVGLTDISKLDLETATDALVMWLRGHDIGHSIVLPTTSYKVVGQVGRWNSMSLQEAIADSYGILLSTSAEWSALSKCSSDVLASLFLAELLRYLRKGPYWFPDSSAALMELSFLVKNRYVLIDQDLKLRADSQTLLNGMLHLTQVLTSCVLKSRVGEITEFLNEYYFSSYENKINEFVSSLILETSDIPSCEHYTERMNAYAGY
ncbi:hypothetical protein [Alicyclobacillus acidocaldarius]|uniref:Uncharacterized protein n=1 Tax=Alicyclobacillus acidocaldarius (strain Tc-4-1) TaxID=1048834 RepID=F8ICR4_ALIAT|nr:hypothetical protein [Alicyclobacillus acidocaldarius]AEJ43729.1 hypothetical protein TC41_1809 [Alicyclobacillus acidocaldarius subsp. acidocaldarius Tc-4-1]